MRFIGQLAFILLLLLVPPAGAQEGAPSSVEEGAPASVEEFVRLLDDPDVRVWLRRATDRAVPATPVATAPSERMSSRLDKVRDHLRAIVTALPRLPGEARKSSELLMREVSERGTFEILLLIAAFAALGYGS